MMYFMMLPKVRRPSRTPSCSTSRSCSQQDHVGRLLGHVDRAVDRDADIGRVQRRRVVDAVAEIADDVAARACSARMMRFFCAGVTRQNRLTCSTRAAQRRRRPAAGSRRRSARRVDRHARAAAQTWRVTSSLSPVTILTATPLGRQRGQRRRGARLGRVEEGGEAGEDQLGLVAHHGVRMVRATGAPGDAEHAEALAAERVEQRLRCARAPRRPAAALPRRRRLRSCVHRRRMSSGAPLTTSSRAAAAARPAPRRGGARSRTAPRRSCASR